MNPSNKYVLVAAAISISAMACSSSDPVDVNAALQDQNTDANTGLNDQSVVQKLREMGLQAASTAGASTPTTMRAVSVSDHQAAEMALSGSIIYDHFPVYVIVMTGGPFTSEHAPVGVPDPEGHVLTVTVDAATYEVTDVGIADVEPDLSEVASASVDLSAN